MVTIPLKILDAQKLNLGPGDVLVVTVKSDEITIADCELLKERLQALFTNNKIVLSIIPANSDLTFQVISPKEG